MLCLPCLWIVVSNYKQQTYTYWIACTKTGKWAVMYLCVRGIDVVSYYDFSVRLFRQCAIYCFLLFILLWTLCRCLYWLFWCTCIYIYYLILLGETLGKSLLSYSFDFIPFLTRMLWNHFFYFVLCSGDIWIDNLNEISYSPYFYNLCKVLKKYLAFQSFDFECTWWRLFHLN